VEAASAGSRLDVIQLAGSAFLAGFAFALALTRRLLTRGYRPPFLDDPTAVPNPEKRAAMNTQGMTCGICLFAREGPAADAVTVIGGYSVCEDHLACVAQGSDFARIRKVAEVIEAELNSLIHEP
jgi:hypothetical protein